MCKIGSLTTISANQSGFISEDGTLANSMVLHSYITSRRVEGKSYNVVSLDVKKAFDTVVHDPLLLALRRFKIPQYITRYIKSSLETSYTRIIIRKNKSGMIYPKRGVKQGNPFSPILFNLVIDEL